MKTTLEEVKKFNLKHIGKVKGGITNNPVTIQEKLRWLNIYEIPWNNEYSMPLKSVCSDKLLIKEYIKNLIGVDICVPTIAVYNNTKEIEWDKLPNKFIIKVNHNSGGTIICRDKNLFDKTSCISKLNYWMNDDFTFRNGFESHYHWIDRKILVEELLEDETQKESLFDYKFWCFNGEPQLYTINNGHGHGDIMYYRMDNSEYNLYKINSVLQYKKPKQFNLMVEYAKKIARLFKFVRVDFYEVNGRVYLGELTFVPGAALFHYKLSGADTAVGKLLNIELERQINPNKKNFLIVHYNTPKLTECLVKSINKFVGTDCSIYIFDNSDRLPFTYNQENMTVFDNTHGQIIDFEHELQKYPNRERSLGKYSRWGSFKHCISVDKCFDLIDDNFILLDSDVLLKRGVGDLFDDSYYACGEIRGWSWYPQKIYPNHPRLLPFITFINVKKCKTEGIRYFDENHMAGLYTSITTNDKAQLDKDSYDTGCWLYSQISTKPLKNIKYDDYIVHFGNASWNKSGRGKNEKLTVEQWLKKYEKYYAGKNKKVIYTCITGGYDTIIEPSKITSGYDYICFTDDMSITSNTWIIKPLPEEVKNLDNIRKNRYVKTHPHILLPEYETSIYVDGSIKVTGDLNAFINTCDLNNYPIAIPKHPSRTCLYKEGKTCISIKKDTAENINPQMERYRKEGFPENYGLTQNNIIARKHNDENCIKIMDAWWQEILNGSYRDQLSLFYVLWKNQDVKIKQLPSNVCNSIYFKWNPIHSRRKNATKPVKPVSQTQQEINEAKAEIERLQQQIATLKRKLSAVKQAPTINTPTMSVLYNRETENGVATQKRNITNNIVIRQKKRVNKSNMRTFF